MVSIFAETHRIIARNLCANIKEKYGIELHEEKLSWGSVVPDLYPKYKLKKHYLEDSLQFITAEIATLIFMSRFIHLEESPNSIAKKIFSRHLGIISHYLSDFTCSAHANNWRFNGYMRKHVQYEKMVNETAKCHVFEPIELKTEPIQTHLLMLGLRNQVSQQILSIIEEYAEKEPSIETDLDFALALNTRMASFVIDTVMAMQSNKIPQSAKLIYS